MARDAGGEFGRAEQGICRTSEEIPAGSQAIARYSGRYQSGQMGQTVNLLVYTFGGSNPSLPTNDLQGPTLRGNGRDAADPGGSNSQGRKMRK